MCPFHFMKNTGIWGTLHPFFEGGEIMGRSVANEGFIRALLRKDPFAAYHFYLSDNNQLSILRERLAKEFGTMLREGRFVLGTHGQLPQALRQYDFHCFHLSDCLLHNSQLAMLRNRYAQRIFPVTGCTHTLSYARYMPLFLQQMWAGTSARDVVIATSRAAVGMVSSVFARLGREYGAECNGFALPGIERIPLGIDLASFPQPDRVTRHAVRAGLGAGESDTVLLAFARISHYSKMDLLPLLRAVQRLCRMGIRPETLHLVVAGFMQQGDTTPHVLGGFAKALGIRLHVISAPTDTERNGLYGAADIFVSPVDNMQETFGLTLLEAGAMGLPVVASDYDGYRDLVVDGETGLLVPTLGPAATQDIDLLSHLAFDTATHLETAQRTVVDVPALAGALHALIAHPEARRRMGAQAARHVRANYGWETVIGQYLALWDRLNSLPVNESVLRSAHHPLRTAYADLFGGYPSAVLAGDMQLMWSRSGEAVYRGVEQPVVYEGVADIVDADLLRFMLFTARKGISAGALTVLVADRMRQVERVERGEQVERANFPVESGAETGSGKADSELPDLFEPDLSQPATGVTDSPMLECRAQALLLWALKHDFLERVPQ
jgi:glycosyltransferase involved in cell wall biosynthesis